MFSLDKYNKDASSIILFQKFDTMPNLTGYTNLVKLVLEKNDITDLNNLDKLLNPSILQVLSIVHNKIKTINLKPFINLTELHLSHMLLTELNDLPSNLIQLNCSHNKIRYLDRLPCRLEHLTCDNNYIREIKNIPSTLKTLICYNNNIRKLNIQYTVLETLACNHNGLKYLIDLPNTLINLYCSFNFLERIDLPKNLQTLYCWSNRLNYLYLNDNLTSLICERNQIYYLEIPDSLKNLSIKFTLFDEIIESIRASYQTYEIVNIVRAINKFRRFYYLNKYGPIIIKKFYAFIKRRNNNLHLELLFSPSTKFYQKEWSEHTKRFLKN